MPDRKASIKDVVNEALRQGLREMRGKRQREPFHTKPIEGPVPLMDIDNIAEVIAASEGKAFK